MKKTHYIPTIIGTIVLLISCFYFLIIIKNEKKMISHTRDEAVSFFVLNKNETNKALIWPRLNNVELVNILNELINALEIDSREKISDSNFLEYNKNVKNYLKLDEFENYDLNKELKEGRNYLSQIRQEIITDQEISQSTIREIVEKYQFYTAASIFREFWFERPFVYFSKDFIRKFLPENNSFIKSKNFYLKGDFYFERYPYEKQLLGDTVENLGIYMTEVPIEYAKAVLINKSKEQSDEFEMELKMFYGIMEKVANNEVHAFVFEYD
jgi:hypothetical protein